MTSADEPTPLIQWLDSLNAHELRELLYSSASRIPEFHDWLEGHRAADAEDPAELLAIVNRKLATRRPFLDYWQANEHADDCAETVALLASHSDRATPMLIPVIERAITLMTRVILKSDDSSGLQGSLIRDLLDAQAAATRTATPPLSQKEQTRLIKWIVKYRYDGKQDFFDPDIVAYAPGLTEKSIEQYRQAIMGMELGPYGRYPLTRLAVLDRDLDAILATNGGEPKNSLLALSLVNDLEEAGLHVAAVKYARVGIELEHRGWDMTLVAFLVKDELAQGNKEQAVDLLRDWFFRFPSGFAFESLFKTSELVGVWAREQKAAEEHLGEHHPASLVLHLMETGRADEAWGFALFRVDPAQHDWVLLKLCEHRVREHPADTLPIYRKIIAETLRTAGRQNYRTAANVLKKMRKAAESSGPVAEAEFTVFLAELVEQNRRRPLCIQAFKRAKLIDDVPGS